MIDHYSLRMLAHRQVACAVKIPRFNEQVARVVEEAQVKRGDASILGQPGILITVVKQPQADTRSVTAAVQAALRELEASLPADVLVEPDVYALRDFIDRGVSNVAEANDNGERKGFKPSRARRWQASHRARGRAGSPIRPCRPRWSFG